MPAEGTALYALHWNVHSWTDEAGRSDLDAVVRLISDLSPDIVSLVEVDESGPAAASLDQVASAAGYGSVFVPAFEYGTATPRGCFGNAILTRLPILAVRHHHLLWPVRVYDGTEPSEPRTLLLVQVRSSCGPVWIGSTHLPRTDTVARDNALLELRSITATLPPPWLVLGDFNTAAASWLSGDARLASHPAQPVPTYPASAPDEPIDYCVAPRDHHVRADVLAAPGSDHLPVLVRLDTSS